MKYLYLNFLFLSLNFSLVYTPAFTQSKPNSIKLISIVRNGSVYLRWAPTTPYLWKIGNRNGYIIERYTIRPDGKIQEKPNQGKKLSSGPIKPYDELSLNRLKITEPNAAVLSEMIYGKNFLPDPSGNNPKEIFEKNQQELNRFSLALLTCDMSRELAICAGLMWIDKGVQADKRYIYKLSLATPGSENIEPGVLFVDMKEETKLLPPRKIKAVFEDKKATLEWSLELDKGEYTAYSVEKSIDGKIFKAINSLPFVYMSEKNADPSTAYFVDSLNDNNQKFYYRVKGITPFAEKGPPSEIVSGKGKEDMTGFVVIDKAAVSKNKTVVLEWSFPKDKVKAIKGYYISKANNSDGPFKDINKVVIPSNQFTYSDLLIYLNNYYKIRVIGLENEEVASSFPYLVQKEDDEPPAVPIGLSGSIDSTGIVKLSWKKNTEKDLQGYRIFRANNLKEEFVEVSKTISNVPVFLDTVVVKTLTKVIYYKVISVDNNYNTSEYSNHITIKRPDKIPPVSPLFKLVVFKQDSISLDWLNSTSNDVALYQLLRKSIDSSEFIRILEWKTGDKKNHFSDKKYIPGKIYQYKLIAQDSSGNNSQVLSGEILAEPGIRKSVSELKANANREKKNILFEWKYQEKSIRYTKIYRSINEGNFILYQTLNGDPGKFEDIEVRAGNKYNYKIQMVLQGGVSSLMSNSITVNY